MFACLILGVSFVTAHVKDAFGQRTPRTIEFSKIRDHLDEYKMRRGDQFVVPNVPLTGQSIYDKANRIFALRAGDRGDYGYYYYFYTSPTLEKSLRQRLESSDEVSVVLYCTLVEFVAVDHVNQSPFITKVEAFDDDEKLVWTVVGPQPAKLKLQG
jgi:hypothetical protein